MEMWNLTLQGTGSVNGGLEGKARKFIEMLEKEGITIQHASLAKTTVTTLAQAALPQNPNPNQTVDLKKS